MNLDLLFDYADDLMKNELLFQKAIYLKKYNVMEAIELCKNLLTNNIDDDFKSDVCQTLGNIFGENNQNPVGYFLKSLEYNPKNILNYAKLAAYYTRQGNDK